MQTLPHTRIRHKMGFGQALAWGYLLFIFIWLVLRWLFGDRFWWLMLVNSIGMYLFVPVVPLVVLALWRRKRWVATIATIPLLVALNFFWPYLIPRLSLPSPTSPPAISTLGVLNFNVLYSNEQVDAIAAMILQEQPDLVALQEVQPQMMRKLIEKLEVSYPHFVLGDTHPYGTTAALSRHVISNGYVLDLAADRPAAVLSLEIEGQSITFISAHLRAFGWPQIQYHLQHETFSDALRAARRFYIEQSQQTEILVDEVERSKSDVVILACDCNTKELMQNYRLLADHLTHTSREFGWRPFAASAPTSIVGTFADRNPQHLEYVFYRGPLQPVQVYKLDRYFGSDHYPLVVEFAYPINQ